MSYILDALRKSEQERQIASGHGANLLYPAIAEPSQNAWLKPVLLVGGLAVFGLSLSSYLWLRAPAARPPQPTTAAPAPVGPVAAPLPTLKNESRPARGTPPPAPAVIAQHAPSPPSERHGEGLAKKAVPHEAPPALTPAPPGEKMETAAEAGPKGMPPIVVSGYIRDEQGAPLAIINDKLVREGSEISPGLRLEKIGDESSLFSYRGQHFRR